MRIPFKTIGKGMECGWKERESIVIRNQEQLESMWEQFYSNTVKPPPLRKVDFDSVMWICIFRGQFPTWGYTTEVRRIVQRKCKGKAFIKVHVMETNPCKRRMLRQLFTQPFHIVEIEMNILPVSFIYKERTRWR